MKEESANDTLPSLACYVINLDRAPDRLAQAREAFDAVGLRFQRFPAFDGATGAPGLCRQARYLFYYGQLANPAEIGCYASHLAAMRLFLETDMQYALICEDDFVPDPEFTETVALALKESSSWDILRLAAIRKNSSFPYATLHEPYHLCTTVTGFAVAAAYIVNRKAATRLLRKLTPMILPYDLALYLGWPGVRESSVYPAPGRCQAVTSTIARPAAKPKIWHPCWWTGRGFRLWFRVRRYALQLLRVAYRRRKR